MNDKPLGLEDFKIYKVPVNSEELLITNREGPFIHLGVELLKELAQYLAILGCMYKLDDNNNPRLWTRNEAILGGMMIRIVKLMHGFLDNVCKNRMELANIFTRCLAETAVNLKYLLTFQSDELFDEFVAYSLRTEKRFFEEIESNIEERGHEIPIEIRMKKSIQKSFESSGITPELINSSERSVWGGSIFNRFKKLGLKDFYVGVFGLHSHFVHGNWQEILRYHLELTEGQYLPNPEWDSPSSQPLFAIGFIVGVTALQYLSEFAPDCEDKAFINTALEDCIDRTLKADELHEQYLQRKMQV